MKAENKSETIPTDYYEAAKKHLLARMEFEEEEKINLKIKIATFVIYELSHSTPDWFKSHFLSNISRPDDKNDICNNNEILKVESAFYNVVADYLLSMEAEVDYVKNILAPFSEWQKKDFWKPIVYDAFILAGIYFTSAPEFNKNDNYRIKTEEVQRIIRPRCLCLMPGRV